MKLEKNFLKKCINSFEDISMEDSSFFHNISKKMKDKEYENLRIKYEKLKNLIYYINKLEKMFKYNIY